MSQTRRVASSEDLPTQDGCGSSQSTPQKPRTIFKLNSLPNTPNLKRHTLPKRFQNYVKDKSGVEGGGEEKSCTDSQSEERISELRDRIEEFTSKNQRQEKGGKIDSQKSKLFQDIDEFISNVNTLKRISAARNLDKNAFAHLPEVNQRNKVVLENYEATNMLTEMEGQLESELAKRGFGMRDILMSNDNPGVDFLPEKPSVTSSNEPPLSTDASFISEFVSDDSGSTNSQPTVFQNVEDVIKPTFAKKLESGNKPTQKEQHRQLRQQQTHSNQQKSQQSKTNPSYFESQFIDNTLNPNKQILPKVSKSQHELGSSRLLSLHNLWDQTDSNKNPQEVFFQRLEEEKIKRLHCERLIQDLQGKTLELQEKIAVAVEVDRSKDEAILKFHEAWEKVAIRLQGLTREKNSLEEDLQEFQAKSALDLAEAAKKIAHYECETSKALNLAHAAHENIAVLEKTNEELTRRIEEGQRSTVDYQSKYQVECEKIKHFSEIIADKEVELSKTKVCLENARQEIAESKRAVDLCQAEFITMKTQYTQLELQINKDRDQIRQLEMLNKKLVQDLETQRKMERNLQVELSKVRDQGENHKVELRNFYQDQVEIVVRDKLKEFQAQLDQAENSLQDELKKKEVTIVKSAALHIQQITDKHQLEIQLLEEKQKEEVRLYQIQLTQAHRRLEDLQIQLQQQRDYKANIAERLQKVMEAQWQEAIRILNNGKSPGMSGDVSLDQLNSLKSKSYNNVEELLNQTDKNMEAKWSTLKDNSNTNKKEIVFDSTLSSGDFEDIGRRNFEMTPVTTRNAARSRQQIENDLHKFINMLLDKSKQTVEKDHEAASLMHRDTSEEQRHELSSWQAPVSDENRAMKSSSSNRKSNKPPWK